GPVDDLVDRLAVHVALVGLVPAPLVRPERRDDARLLRRRAKWLRTGVAVDHGEQDVAPAPRVAVVARERVVLSLVLFHPLRDQEPLEGAVGLDDRFGLEPAVEALLPVDVAALLIYVLVRDGHPEGRLVRVVQRDRVRLEERLVQLPEPRAEGEAATEKAPGGRQAPARTSRGRPDRQ